MKKLFLTSLLFLFALFSATSNECLPERSDKLVNDFAGVISSQTENLLERKLVDFDDTTSTQITLVTVEDLCGEQASFFAFALGEKWGVGSDEFDNGVVVLFKPKQPNSKGEVFIATGYGLEGVLPDATAKLIVESEMIPAFKQGDVEQGLLNGIQTIIDITGGEYSAKSYNKSRKGGFPIVAFIFIIVIALFMFGGTFMRARNYATRNNTSLWLALWLMGSSSRRHGGYFGNFGQGKGGFGGFGGGSGGFGGFGGGSFGGGGAGGSW